MERQFGRYLLLDRLGAGGMAEVWKAKSFGVEGFEKTLVLKRILPELASVPELLEMFVHEAKLSVRLSHANIVQVFDLGRVEENAAAPPSYYIAMEYVAGLDLATLLARCRRSKTLLPFGMAVFVAAEVAKALDHAHRRRDERGRPLGIVHRDVSPQNILISWEGEVKVTDFGIAKAIGIKVGDEVEEGSAPRIRGKLSYMSPEQSLAQPLDGRSDLFALGTVLYEVIAGTNPFATKSDAETLRRVRAAEVPPIEIARPDVPRELVTILRRLLARDPADRFADAGKLHEQLLGYFYASGDRFGASDLAELVAPLQEPERAPELEAGAALEDHVSAEERTPVEVPHAHRGNAPRGADQVFAAEHGERREVSVLVVCGPLDVRAAHEVVTRHGGVIIEEEPSQLVALFGLEEADGRDTEAAVRAALVILRAQKGSAISAGVDVGRALVDARGAPIVDARLSALVAEGQALARVLDGDGRVAVSHRAARVARSGFTFEDLRISAGLPEGGRVVSSARPPIEALGKFVGRKDELRRIGEILAAATRKRAQVVTILGEKGIGKTRFLSEVERRLGRGNWSVGFYFVTCPPSGAELSWSGLRAMLEVLCGVQEGDGEQAILATLPRLRALGLQEDECRAVLQKLGAQLSDGAQTSAGGAAVALRSAFARMVQKLCEDRMHVFVWDDVHAMDAATAEVIASVASRSEGAASAMRAVFLLATRTAPPSALLPLARHHVITLPPLGDEESARLVSTRIGVKDAPPELYAFCRERAAGHPLFLEELLRELVDSRAIEVEDGVVRLRLEGARAVPRALRTLMESRLGRLAPLERATLHAAAVLGDPVHTEVLAALVGQSFSAVDRVLADLAAKGFLRATGPAEVSFTSPMHGEIVLDTIPHEARRELSARAADSYLAVFGDDGSELASERIGHHLHLAGERDRAATYLARAGLHRRRVGQLEPAIQLLLRAIDLADLDRRDANDVASWLRELCAAVMSVRAAAPDLSDLAARALRRIDAAGSVSVRVLSRVDVARALGACNMFDRAYAIVDLAFKTAAGEEELERRVLVAEIEMGTRSGDYARAARAADKLEQLGPVDDPRTLFGIAHARAATGVAAAALIAIARAEALSPVGDLALDCEREKQRVLVYAFMRDFRAATEASARAVELARAAGLRAEIAVTLHNMGDTSRRLGDLPRAYASLTESLEIAEEAGLDWLVSIDRIHLAYLDGMSSKAGAEARLQELIRNAEARGYHTDALEGRALLAELFLHRGEHEEAKRELTRVLRSAESFGNGLIADDARVALAKLG